MLYAVVLRRKATDAECTAWSDVIEKSHQQALKAFLEFLGSDEALRSVQAQEMALPSALQQALTSILEHLLGRVPSHQEFASAVRISLRSSPELAQRVLALSDKEASTLLCSDESGNTLNDDDDLIRVIAARLAALSPTQQAEAASQGTPAADAEVSEQAIRQVILLLYVLILQREANPAELNNWIHAIQTGDLSFPAAIVKLYSSSEAAAARSHDAVEDDLSDGLFIQFAYEAALQRSPFPDEIVTWEHRLSLGATTRGRIASSVIHQGARESFFGSKHSIDPTYCQIMGTAERITAEQWKERASRPASERPEPHPRFNDFALPQTGNGKPLVSCIASLYRGGCFIRNFLANITGQSFFRNHAELIIIDANSPEDEQIIISEYMSAFPNIRYIRTPERVGIYEAWNIGIREASGFYITNTNIDDLRRNDSLELQALALNSLPFVDVIYQDFYYYFDAQASFEEIETAGVRSNLPIISPYNLMRMNSPHNAPMWRRGLHDELGFFDESYQSAGDYEFWLRCAAADKVFYKLNDPHVGYYLNPEGISTNPNTPGMKEARQAMLKHGRSIISPQLLMTPNEFLDSLHNEAGKGAPFETRKTSSPHWRYVAVQDALLSLARSAALAEDRLA